MKKENVIPKLTVALIFAFSNCAYSQADSIKSEILKYEHSQSEIISKGRRLLLDKFVEGDMKKVKEVKDYLAKTEDDNYIAFYPAEYWLLLFWTGEYKELAKDIQSFDSARAAGYYTRIRPPYDMLYNQLEAKTFENEMKIKAQIRDSEIDNETKEILVLNLDWLLLENRRNIYAQDILNKHADNFLEKYTSSNYEGFARKHIRFKQVPADWGFAFEFFTGYGVYTGNLQNNYTNNIPIGVAFDICYKNFELYLRDYIGFNKTKKDFDYSLGTWEKGSRTMVFLPEASIGYATHNDNRFKTSPFAGIGSMDIGPTLNASKKTPELDEVALEFTTTYVLGINLDIKFGPKQVPAYKPKTNYGFMRIRYAYNIPRFEKKYEAMSGNMHYLTVGFGGMSRGLKRQY